MASAGSGDYFGDILVLRPTLEEFTSFPRFLRWLQHSPAYRELGLIKVVPPNGWAKFDYERQMEGMIITPIIQAPMTQKPGQVQLGITEASPMTFAKFKEWAEARERRPPMDTSAPVDTVDWKKLERRLWGSLSTTSEPPRYGSDNLGTLFPEGEDAHGWNIDKLDTELQLLGDIPGVTRSMLYFGAWRSVFAWHTEDMDLFSLNYLHWGAPKLWYTVPPEESKRLESLAQAKFPEVVKATACNSFLRHKTTLLSPDRLTAEGITVVRALQEPGDIMLTYAGAYHAGFNSGLNCAESVNFAAPLWWGRGENAVRSMCICRPDHVRINLAALKAVLLEFQERGGEATWCDGTAKREAAAVAEQASSAASATDPASTDPASTDPASTDPASTDPASTDPAFSLTPGKAKPLTLATLPRGPPSIGAADSFGGFIRFRRDIIEPGLWAWTDQGPVTADSPGSTAAAAGYASSSIASGGRAMGASSSSSSALSSPPHAASGGIALSASPPRPAEPLARAHIHVARCMPGASGSPVRPAASGMTSASTNIDSTVPSSSAMAATGHPQSLESVASSLCPWRGDLLLSASRFTEHVEKTAASRGKRRRKPADTDHDGSSASSGSAAVASVPQPYVWVRWTDGSAFSAAVCGYGACSLRIHYPGYRHTDDEWHGIDSVSLTSRATPSSYCWRRPALWRTVPAFMEIAVSSATRHTATAAADLSQEDVIAAAKAADAWAKTATPPHGYDTFDELPKEWWRLPRQVRVWIDTEDDASAGTVDRHGGEVEAHLGILGITHQFGLDGSLIPLVRQHAATHAHVAMSTPHAHVAMSTPHAHAAASTLQAAASSNTAMPQIQQFGAFAPIVAVSAEAQIHPLVSFPVGSAGLEASASVIEPLSIGQDLLPESKRSLVGLDQPW